MSRSAKTESESNLPPSWKVGGEPIDVDGVGRRVADCRPVLQ